VSVIVTIVLLKVATICATATVTFRRAFFFLDFGFVALATFYFSLRASVAGWRGTGYLSL